MAAEAPVTELLHAWRAGEEDAFARLSAVVYEDLSRLARVRMGSERADHTLTPSDLVQESFLRLMRADVPWSDRAHFFAVAARMMRRVLIDHARAKNRDRRGGNPARVTLAEAILPHQEPVFDVLVVDEVLRELEELDEQQARFVELYHFAGLTLDEIAMLHEVSAPTVHRRLASAHAWMAKLLRAGHADPAQGAQSPARTEDRANTASTDET